jgi:tetratricopeptide (TPR) repeat protein
MKHLKRIGFVLILALALGATAAAQDPSVLLEKGIYAEETLGNLSEAIGIYQQVIAATDANRATAALALFRLGMCYQKLGRTADAQAAFSKLAKLYPEQKDLIAKLPAAASKELALRPAPWVAGEVLQFAIKVNLNVATGSVEAGTAMYRADSVRENGKAAWRFQSILEQVTGIVQLSSMRVDASTLTPISSSIAMPVMGMRYKLSYTPGQVEQLNIKKDGTVAKTILPLDRATYDYSQLAMLIRCLPLREGFQAAIPMVFPAASLVYEVKVSVPVREKVTVPAGTFDCYKTIVNLAGQELTYWISDDANAYIVKLNQLDLMTLELNSIKKVGLTQPVSFEDREFGITLSAPSPWYIIHSKLQSMIHLIEPETEAEGTLIMSGEPGKLTNELNDLLALSLDEAVNKYAAGMQKARPGYSIRPGSLGTITISGLPAIRYAADCKHLLTGQDTVEYTHFFAKSGKLYRLILQAGAGKFDSMKADFDSIASSLLVQ